MRRRYARPTLAWQWALAATVSRLRPKQAAAGKGEAHQLDALAAVAALEADLAYLDPPYNQHKYRGN